jgi:hypothetical protein
VDSAIEVRYAGVVVGRATHVKAWSAEGAFIGFAEPLPTGTRIELRGDELRQAVVDEAIESSDPAVSGMRVSFVSPPSSSSSPPPPAASETGPAPSGGGGGGGGKRRRRR